MVDLYGNAEKYRVAKAALETWPVPPATRRAIRAYVAAKIEHLSPGRRYTDLGALRRIFCGTRTGRPPLVHGELAALSPDAAQRAADQLSSEARGGQLRRETFRVFKRHLIGVYRYHVGTTPRPREAKVLTSLQDLLRWPVDRPENWSVQTYYTADEIHRILTVARKPQERALIAVGLDTGARPNEYLSLCVGDVQSTPHGFILRSRVSKQVGGLTRTRNLYVLALRADFATFWNQHPYRHDPTHPLFYRDDNSAHRGERLGPAGLNKILKKYDRLSGVNKNGSAYFLRHTHYTLALQAGAQPDLAGADMGWAPGAPHRKRYTHLTDDDVLRERLRLAGHHFEHHIQPTLQARICPHCNQANSPTATHCTTCGQQLDMQQVFRELEELKANQAALVERTLRELLARHNLEFEPMQ